MNDNIKKVTLKAGGMTCTGCENKIENVVSRMKGVISVKAEYKNEKVSVEYDANIVNLSDIMKRIERLQYKVDIDTSVSTQTDDKKKENLKILGIVIAIIAIFILVESTIGFNFAPEIQAKMSYPMLFVIGLLTSIHCVAMCGGINISQCSKYKFDDNGKGKTKKFYPSLLYNLGRVVSYTIVGGIVGAIGSAVSFSGTLQWIIIILSGILMLIVGINMLNIFPFLRKFNPTIPRFLRKKVNKEKSGKGPFIVGLLNGLMPCGPLQAMQIYALTTGSAISGALSMFIFSIGTVPLMFILGLLSSVLNSKFNEKMQKVSAVLVILLSFTMISRGLNLSGINFSNIFNNDQETEQTNINNNTNKNTNTNNNSKPNTTGTNGNSSNNSNTTSTPKLGIAVINGDVQEVTTNLTNGRYYAINVQKGIPVKWTIKVKKGELDGCNNPINIPEYGIRNKKLVVGDNLIEFTPTKTGKFTYTCWMGMQRGTISVVDDISKYN